MIKAELIKRIKKAQYIDDEEKNELLAELPDLKPVDIVKLNDIFIEADNEHEVLTQANDFAVAGLMQAFITMNDLELKEQNERNV